METVDFDFKIDSIHNCILELGNKFYTADTGLGFFNIIFKGKDSVGTEQLMLYSVANVDDDKIRVSITLKSLHGKVFYLISNIQSRFEFFNSIEKAANNNSLAFIVPFTFIREVLGESLNIELKDTQEKDLISTLYHLHSLWKY